jgi:AbrB family looped-hinge helix DNA binding protein
MALPSEITTVTDRGQTSIPAELRRELKLVKGQRLLWERVGDRELRVRVLEEGPPRGAEAMRGFARRFRREARSSADWMSQLREGER